MGNLVERSQDCYNAGIILLAAAFVCLLAGSILEVYLFIIPAILSLVLCQWCFHQHEVTEKEIEELKRICDLDRVTLQ